MKIQKYFFIILFIIIGSCNKQKIPETITDENGIALKRPLLWKVSLSDNEYTGTTVKPSLIYDNKIILGASRNNLSEIAQIDIETGEKIWQKSYYNDYLSTIYYAYTFQNKAVVERYVDTGFRCLNLETGEEEWAVIKQGWFWFTVSGFEDIFFYANQTETVNKPYSLWSAWYGDIETGDVQEFFVPDITAIPDTSSINNVGGVGYITPYKSNNGDLFLVISHSNYFEGKHYFNLYNFTTKVFIYQNIELSSGSNRPYITNDKIFFALNDEICCYDLYTGEELWCRSIPSYTVDFLADGDKVFAIFEKENYEKYLTCYDTDTGNINWCTPSKQSNTALSCLNGILYFVADDHKLHAVDAATGKYLWKIEPPNYTSYHGFRPQCSVVSGKDGEKGKVIVSSYLNGFCYEAIK